MRAGEHGAGVEEGRLVDTKQSWDAKQRTGRVFNNILITMCGTSWVMGVWRRRDHCKVYDSLSTRLCT